MDSNLYWMIASLVLGASIFLMFISMYYVVFDVLTESLRAH